MDIIDRLQIEARWNPHQPVWREILAKIEELRHALKYAEISLEGKRTEIQKLRAFARAVMSSWPEGGLVDRWSRMTTQTVGDNYAT